MHRPRLTRRVLAGLQHAVANIPISHDPQTRANSNIDHVRNIDLAYRWVATMIAWRATRHGYLTETPLTPTPKPASPGPPGQV